VGFGRDFGGFDGFDVFANAPSSKSESYAHIVVTSFDLSVYM
jgi:hypothetical protein